ncbi:hydrocephalus-inducing protein homolog [Nomia melanderi]|uniref:hydrocephalus-inducing protein homolog n=1 Tax=Nomia melanderi TaxID=2448451 RepID=UPI003FCEA5C7
MEETYLGLSRSKVLTIHNGSDHVVNYKWMLLKDSEADELRRTEYRRLFHLVYESELVRSVNLVHYNVCMPDIHQLVYQRIYADEIESLKKETFPYCHISFMLTPEEGEIWPQSSTDVTVLFRALEVGEVSSIAYLEVTGRESRIPLSLHGTGKGPYFRLNVLTIDMCNVYLCSVHNFEVIVANKGHIPGTMIYKPKPADFGGTIKITPTCLFLKPDEHKSFNLRFSSNRKGDFVERLDFIVKESLEVHSLHIKGCIVCPTLHFDKESLDFGATPLGFSSKQEVCLHNQSLVPVAFSLRLLNDGHQTPLTYEEFARAQMKPSFPSDPREFFVTPETGVVSASGFLKLKVIYTANIVRDGRTRLEVDLWDSDSDALALTIEFRGVVACLSIVPSEIVDRYCFLNHPCTKTFDVVNASDFDGFFYLPPQPVSDNPPVIYSLSTNQGLIKAGQKKAVCVTIITRILGNQTLSINMLAMGEESPKLACTISYIGQGPLISTEPTFLDLENIPVLEDVTTSFLVTNDSPIPAQFSVSMHKLNLLWTANPHSGYLNPHESMKINITLRLRDAGKFRDRIVLILVNNRAISIEIRAYGVGCSVVFEPRIFPVCDLGFMFSHQTSHQTITVTNYGTIAYQIVWSNTPQVQINRGQLTGLQYSMFQIKPLVFEIEPEEKIVVHCELLWEINECVTEDWYVFGRAAGASRRELIGSSTFKAVLTEPQILFDKKELAFRVDVCPDGEKRHQTEELLVTNMSKLHINAELSVKAPFHLVNDEEQHSQSMKVILYDGQVTKVRLFFSVNDSILYSQNYNGVLQFEYDEHPNKDRIVCKGLVNLPNLVLEPANCTVNCELGSSAEKILTLTNNGPVSVVYKFLWIEDSIEMERYTNDDCECSVHTHPTIRPATPGAPVSAATNEGGSANDRQDGGGDGPLQSIPPPMNSPVSETHAQKLKLDSSTEDDAEEDKCAVSKEEMREFLLPLVEKYFEEELDLAAFETMRDEPRRTHYVNDILEIIPREGTVPPYTTQHVHVGFHGFERLRIKATAVCQILRGPTEQFQLCARSDAIRFAVDTDTIDFGQQPLLESGRRRFALRNNSGVAFGYKITGSNAAAPDETVDNFDINPLMVEPNTGFVDAQSFVEFDVEHRPTILGPIDHRFQLEIGHLMPATITVKAIGSFPQVFPCMPRGNLHRQHSIESEYAAIGSLTDEFLANLPQKTKNALKDCDSSLNGIDLPDDLVELLSGEGWAVVSYEEMLPNVADVEMAVERHLARKLVDGNSYVLMQYAPTLGKEPIPHLFSSEYVIDMEYVIIGQVADCSARMINYGPWSVEMRLRKWEKQNPLEKLGIAVQFKRRLNLMVGESAIFRVIWHPTAEKYKEKCARVERTVYIEVIRGCTIPVTIKGTVTYPYVTVSTKFLDFQDVLVGECLAMHVQIRNE